MPGHGLFAGRHKLACLMAPSRFESLPKPPRRPDQQVGGQTFSAQKLAMAAIVAMGCGAWADAASAASTPDARAPGVSDTEVRVGNMVPYSGPASAYGVLGKILSGYFQRVNDEGGINGRKIRFISYDDGYSPPKAVEQTRKLIEQDQVLFIAAPLGTPSNTAIMKYMNANRIPQLFLMSGGSKFGVNPAANPWTMPFNASYDTEGRIYARHILASHPGEKIGVLYQNDDFGKDLYKGLRDGLGDKASLIVADAAYEVSDPTVDSQMVKLKASGATVLVNLASPKFAAQAIRKLGEMEWRPAHVINSAANSVQQVLAPGGVANARGAVSVSAFKDPTDPAWANDPAIAEWKAFAAKYVPEADANNVFAIGTYAVAQTLGHVLKQAGPNPTRDSVMKAAASLHGFRPDVLLPGITMNTGPADYQPIKQMQLIVFDGDRWKAKGGVLSSLEN